MAEPGSQKSLTIKQQFYLSMGECISAWAFVEDALFELCHAVIGCKKERAAIIFGRTPTLETRVALVSELMLTLLPKKERKDGGHDHAATRAWLDLVKEVKRLLPVRNTIAHRPVTQAAHFNPKAGRQAIYALLDQLEVG